MGEDYRSLGEGLRRIDEMVTFGCFEYGDRLGHAIALGVDPRDFRERRSVVVQPAEERLQDLLWELDLRQRGKIGGANSRVAAIERSVRELLRDVLIVPWTVEEAMTLRTQLFDEHALFRGVRYPACHLTVNSRYSLLHDFLVDDRLARRSCAPFTVCMDDGELEALLQLRAYVWRRVAARGLTIETNLSSNMLVGDFGTPDGHPVWAFRSPPDELPTLAVSANDDDPITFATSLPDEYAYLYASKLRHGEGQAQVLAWIDELREAALVSRFTLDLRDRPRLLASLATYDDAE